MNAELIIALWDFFGNLEKVVSLFVITYIFAKFLKPFFIKPQNARIAGLCYLFGGLFADFVPWEMLGMTANLIRTLSMLTGALFAERRNIRQKIFLSLIVYLLPWIVHAAVVIPWDFLYDLLLLNEDIVLDPIPQLIMFVLLEALYCVLRCGLIYLLTRLILRIYIYKREELSAAELTLMLLPTLPALIGFWLISYFEQQFLDRSDSYVWNEYPQYMWLMLLYQAVSLGAVIASVFMSQKIKQTTRDEKESAVLAEQTEEIKRRIEKLEAVYGSVRDFRHDALNHLATLEALYKNGETEEAERYRQKFARSLDSFPSGIKSGNPVTDMILDEKSRLAAERGIRFGSTFFFPENAGIDAFDVSVILNNALDNAIENASSKDGEPPFIEVSSRREKNACLIEIKNSFTGSVSSEKNELPETTKPDRLSHGFGLPNIRRTARKYHGDISFEAKNSTASLTIMLMCPLTTENLRFTT